MQSTQAAAQDAIKLSHEISALYLDSAKSEGVIVRLVSLPADLIHDAAGGNIIDSRTRDRTQKQLDEKMKQIEQRLNDVQNQGLGAPLAATN